MVDMLITLVVVVVIVGVVCLFLKWAMPELGIPPVIQKVIWVLVVLLAFLVVLALFGYGPLHGIKW